MGGLQYRRIMRTVIELAEKILKSRVHGRNNGRYLHKILNSSLDGEDGGENGNSFDERSARKKIEQTLDILDAKGLHSLMEHFTVDPSTWK